MLKLTCWIYLCLIFIGSGIHASGQEALKKEEVLLKLDDFIGKYRELSNFGPEFLNARTTYVKDFNSLFSSSEEPLMCNDLPQKYKSKNQLSSQNYTDILFKDFSMGLIAGIQVDSISIVETETSAWDIVIMVNKTFYGAHYISDNNISYNLKLNILFDGDFKITQISNTDDQDLDGLTDVIDECNDEYGFHKFNGCPDIDDDGIVDKIDRCTDTPEGQAINKYGCYRYFYEDHGFMELNFNPLISLFNNYDFYGENTGLSGKSSGDLPSGFKVGSQYGISLIKSLHGNYINKSGALKIGFGFQNNKFNIYSDTQSFEENSIWYSYFNVGYRIVHTEKKYYYGAGLYFLSLFNSQTSIDENLALDNSYRSNNFNKNPLAYYCEAGYHLKIKNYAYLNLGVELIFNNQFMNSSPPVNTYTLTPQIKRKSELTFGLKTALVIDLKGDK